MMRRIPLLVLLLLLAAVAIPVAPSLGQASQPAAVQPDGGTWADFNQDGFPDLAVGVAGEDIGTVRNAGAVNVLYGTASGLSGTGSQFFTQVGGAVEPEDSFGLALASGDFNRDGYADLAAGAPAEDVGTLEDAGAVSVLYGTAAGLTTHGGRLFTQVGGAVEAQDNFGGALTSGDFNQDGYADLAAGATVETVGTLGGAGAVSVLYGSAAGLSTTGGRLFTQAGGAVEPHDGFGKPLTSGDFNHDGYADLAAGAPFEDVGSVLNAGAVSVLYGSAAGLTTTGGRLFIQVGGIPEVIDSFGHAVAAGDFNRDGFADLAAGAPLETVGRVTEAGAVSVLYGSAAGLTTSGGRLFTQAGNPAERLDHFGNALAAGDVNHDGFADLAAGAPGETVGGVISAGAVSVLYGAAAGLSSSGGRLFTQVGDPIEASDTFGDVLAVGDFNHDGLADLAASATGEDVGTVRGAGALSTMYGTPGGLSSSGGQLFTQDTPEVPDASENGDTFGLSLTAGSPFSTGG